MGAQESVQGEEPAREGVTVLLAEDEYLIRLDIAESLRRIGWQVLEVGTADDAIQLIHSRISFDLLLTDVHMPGSATGLDLARLVREQRPAVRIAVMSGQLQPEPEIIPLFDLFIPKPAANLLELLQGLMHDAASQP
jgi:two-component system, response regulator PdtaR